MEESTPLERIRAVLFLIVGGVTLVSTVVEACRQVGHKIATARWGFASLGQMFQQNAASGTVHQVPAWLFDVPLFPPALLTGVLLVRNGLEVLA